MTGQCTEGARQWCRRFDCVSIVHLTYPCVHVYIVSLGDTCIVSAQYSPVKNNLLASSPTCSTLYIETCNTFSKYVCMYVQVSLYNIPISPYFQRRELPPCVGSLLKGECPCHFLTANANSSGVPHRCPGQRRKHWSAFSSISLCGKISL